jgi:hypothetical protein
VCEHGGWTQRQVADECNNNHPGRNQITHRTVGELLKKPALNKAEHVPGGQAPRKFAKMP